MFAKNFNDLVDGILLQHIGLRPQIHRGVEHVLLLVHGQDDDLHAERQLAEGADRFQPVEARHVDVEDDNLGFQAGHQSERLLAIGRLAHDPETRIVIDHIAHPAAQERVVIHDQHRWIGGFRGDTGHLV